MKLTMLKERQGHRAGGGQRYDRECHALRLVDRIAPVVEWPRPVTETSSRGRVTVLADVRAKRFGERAVENERYTATINAESSSPYAMMAALADAFSGVEEFQRSGAEGERLILEISLRR